MVTKGGRRRLKNKFFNLIHLRRRSGQSVKEAQWPIGYGVGLRIKRSWVRIRPWPLRWVLGQGSLLPLSHGEAFTLASISYLAILVKYILAKKKKKLSESFKSVAQGVPEIFEEVYLGGHNVPPPPGWDRVKPRVDIQFVTDLGLIFEISDLGEAEVWYLVVNEWLKVHYLWATDRVTDDRWPENIVRKKTNATKYPLARRKDAQARLVDGQPASGSHDKRTSSTNLQLLTAKAIGSGGNKLSLGCCHCSPSRHETDIQKQNLTYQEKSVVSSLLVCKWPDFFKTCWWT